MNENPWAEFQQYQQPGQPLGATLAGQPPSQQQAQGMTPPTSQEDYANRVQGWMGAFNEMLQNPGVAAMLIQMGTSLSSGQYTGGEAVAQGFGAMGRMGLINEKFAQQGRQNQMAERKMAVDERGISLEEEVQREQMKMLKQRAARGGTPAKDPRAELDKWEAYFVGKGMSVPEARQQAQLAMGMRQPAREGREFLSPRAQVLRDELKLLDPRTPEYETVRKQLYDEVSGGGGQAGAGSPMTKEDMLLEMMRQAQASGRGFQSPGGQQTPPFVGPPEPDIWQKARGFGNEVWGAIKKKAEGNTGGGWNTGGGY